MLEFERGGKVAEEESRAGILKGRPSGDGIEQAVRIGRNDGFFKTAVDDKILREGGGRDERADRQRRAGVSNLSVARNP